MGFNLNGIGHLISQAGPGGGQFVNIFNQVANPIAQVANPFVNIASSALQSIMTLPITLTQAVGKSVQGLSGMLSSPSFVTILVIGGLGITALVVLNGGPTKMIR